MLFMRSKKIVFLLTVLTIFILQIIFYKPQTSFRVDGESILPNITVLGQKIKNSDFILVYNPGGEGGMNLDKELDWKTVIDGIKGELNDVGYKVSVVEYMRSDHTILGYISAFKEVLSGFKSSSKELADKLNFFLEETNKTIIVTGESFGAAYSSKVMDLIEDKEKTYSVQAGMPFFLGKKDKNTNILFLTSNGQQPDPIYEGNIFELLKQWIMRGKEGNGHVYNWNHKYVAEEIRSFIRTNFGILDT